MQGAPPSPPPPPQRLSKDLFLYHKYFSAHIIRIFISDRGDCSCIRGQVMGLHACKRVAEKYEAKIEKTKKDPRFKHSQLRRGL